MKKTKTPPPPPAPEPVAAGKPWWHFALPLGLLLALFVVYAPALRGPFLFDDLRLPFTKSAELALPVTFFLSGVRPLLSALFWLEGNTWGMNPFPYHLLNLLLHAVNGALVWLILRRIVKNDFAALFGAALFLFHPLQTEAVSYIASRSETLSIFFVYSAFAVFLYRSDLSIGWLRALGIMILFGLGAASKEHAVVLIPMIVLTDYWWNPGFTLQGMLRNWRLYTLFILGAVGAASIVLPVLQNAVTAGFGLKDFTWYQYFFTQCRALWVYLLMFIIPAGQNLDHQYPISQTLFDRGAVFGLAALLAAVAAAWVYRKRFPFASYGFFLFLVMIAPTSSFVPIQDALVERRLYLPFLGLLFIVAEILIRLKMDHVRTAALTTVLVLFAWLTWQRNEIYSTAVGIWESSIRTNPSNARAQFQLAYAYYAQGRCAEASAGYARVAQLRKPDYDLLVDWALALDCEGKMQDAVSRLNEALALDRTAHAYATLGMVYGKQGINDQALNAIEEALRLDSNFDMAWAYKGTVLYNKGDKAGAAEAFRKALSLNPQNPTAQQGSAATR
jgi:protein O-mannosyl-transferase